jgi:CYTH domain-containing protein
MSDEQFASVWEQTRGRRLRKTRYRLPLNGHDIELDLFHDDLAGLALAEVEFESDHDLETFEPPAWFGREVTGELAFTNASLAANAPRGQPAA